MKSIVRSLVLSHFASLWFVVCAGAVPIPVTNPGFETDALADGAANTLLTGWTKVAAPDPAGSFNPDVANPPLPTEGSNVAYMNLSGTAAASNGFYQTILTSLNADTVYTVTFDLGNRQGLTTRDTDSTLRGFFTLDGNGANFGAAVGTPFTITLSTVPDGTFLTDQTFTFSTVGFGGSLSQSLNIAFVFDRPAGLTNVNQVEIDNVRASSVPEPSTIALVLGAGALALATLRRRK